MSTHPISAVLEARLRPLVSEEIRPPDNVTANGAGPGVLLYVFDTDLTAPEIATFADLTASVSGSLDIRPADYESIKPEIVALRSFVGLGSATDAQQTAAIKSLIRLLRTLLGD